MDVVVGPNVVIDDDVKYRRSCASKMQGVSLVVVLKR